MTTLIYCVFLDYHEVSSEMYCSDLAMITQNSYLIVMYLNDFSLYNSHQLFFFIFLFKDGISLTETSNLTGVAKMGFNF